MRAKKSIALLGLALGCGLVASIGITQVLARRHSDTATPGEAETVFVAMQDIPLGDFLTSQVLRLEQWPKDKIPTGALSRIEDVEGRRARTRLYAGETILENKLFRKGDSSQGADILIPKGYRVVSVKVDLVSGAANMLLPGSRVDVMVFLTRCSQMDIPETTTRTILQDIKVFAVNDVVNLDAADKDSHKSITAMTISLLVTPEQAAKLMLASEMGKIKLVMRSPEDDQQLGAAQARPNELFDRPLAGEREKETLVEKPAPFLKPAPPNPAPPPTLPVGVLKADKLEDIVLQANVVALSPFRNHVFWSALAPPESTAEADNKPPQPPAAEKPPEAWESKPEATQQPLPKQPAEPAST